MRRPDPRRIRSGIPDPSVTGMAGLVQFGRFLRDRNVDRELETTFGAMKAGPMVVYPMGAQLRLGIDLFVAGETRVFGLEACASDAAFVHLAGGVVPSIDTVYRDLARFDAGHCASLERMVARWGLEPLRGLRGMVHVDIDTSVIPVDGEHEGALPGPNPKFHGRPSFHPLLARVAETDTWVGTLLRPGNTGLGGDDAAQIGHWVKRVRETLHKSADLCVRIDAGGDCTEIIEAIHDQGAYFLIKARLSQDLVSTLMATTSWKTVDRDAFGRPTRQVAELDFRRGPWGNLPIRVIATRTNERESRQIALWAGVDLDSVHVFFTNRIDSAEDIVWDYDGRAGIEPLIAELKGAWGIGDQSSWHFEANHAALLLKVLGHNLVRAWVRVQQPWLIRWRLPWLRRSLVLVPGRISRSGRVRRLHLPPRSPLTRALE